MRAAFHSSNSSQTQTLHQDSQTFELLSCGWLLFCRNKWLLKNQTNVTVRWFTVRHNAFCKYLNFILFCVCTMTVLVLFFGFIVCDVTATRLCLFTVSDMNLQRSVPFTEETNAQTSASLAPLKPSAGYRRSQKIRKTKKNICSESAFVIKLRKQTT